MTLPRNLEATKLMQQIKKQKWATGSPPRKRQKAMAGNGSKVQTSHAGRMPRNSERNDSSMLYPPIDVASSVIRRVSLPAGSFCLVLRTLASGNYGLEHTEKQPHCNLGLNGRHLHANLVFVTSGGAPSGLTVRDRRAEELHMIGNHWPHRAH